MNGVRIHMIPQNGKGGVIFPIWTDEIWYHVLANCICRFIRTERIDSFDMGCFDMKCCYPISSKHLTLQSVFTLTSLWPILEYFFRSSLQSPGRWTTAGEVFPVRQLGQLEINFDKNESLSGELQDAIKRLSTGIPRSSTTYSMNYRPIIKVTRNLITSIIRPGTPYTYIKTYLGYPGWWGWEWKVKFTKWRVFGGRSRTNSCYWTSIKGYSRNNKTIKCMRTPYHFHFWISENFCSPAENILQTLRNRLQNFRKSIGNFIFWACKKRPYIVPRKQNKIPDRFSRKFFWNWFLRDVCC